MSSSSGVTAYTWLGFFAFIFSKKNSLPIFKEMAFAKQMLRNEVQVLMGTKATLLPGLTKDVETTSGEKKIIQ